MSHYIWFSLYSPTLCVHYTSTHRISSNQRGLPSVSKLRVRGRIASKKAARGNGSRKARYLRGHLPAVPRRAQTPVDMSVRREGICAADCSSHRIITFQRDQIPVTQPLPRRASLVQRKELDEKWDCHDSVIATVRTPNRDCATRYSPIKVYTRRQKPRSGV